MFWRPVRPGLIFALSVVKKERSATTAAVPFFERSGKHTEEAEECYIH
jgi:hypothetical protein